MNMPALRRDLVTQDEEWAAHDRFAAAWNDTVVEPRTVPELLQYLLESS